MKVKGIDTRILSGIIALLQRRIPVALRSINFFETHEGKNPVKALVNLRWCFHYLSSIVLCHNQEEQLNYINSAFESVEKAAIEPYQLQLDEHMRRIAVKRNLLKYLGSILFPRNISLKEIDESLAMVNEYKARTEENHRSLKERVDDCSKAYGILHSLDGKIPSFSAYVERAFQILLMLAGVFIGILLQRHLFQ